MFTKKLKKPKVVIFGLDGVPYDLIKDLSERGVMPAFSRLIKEGIFCKMASSIPEVSSVAWSCIITGKNPGEHGIYGFVDLRPGGYKLFFPNFNSLKVKPFWERWDNLRSAIINVPNTYPARPLNGILISGFVALDLEKATYPRNLVSKLEEMGYKIDVDSSKGHRSKGLFLKDLDETFEARTRALFELYDLKEWDIFMFVFTSTDRLMHFFWDAYEDDKHPYHDRFLGYFSKIDSIIAKFIERNEDVVLIILSDHGFERLDLDVNVNVLLQKNGFLSFAEKQTSLDAISANTLAFSLDPARIYINYAGKYPRGAVREGDKWKVIEELYLLFDSLTINGKKVIKKVFKREELYKGPYSTSSPDLVLLPERGFNLRSSFKANTTYSDSVFTGKHSQDNAFFLIKGPLDYQLQNLAVSEVVDKIKRVIAT